jgi:hypothetical protein
VAESNSELDSEAEDQRGGVYQGGAEAKLAVIAAVLRLGKTVRSGRGRSQTMLNKGCSGFKSCSIRMKGLEAEGDRAAQKHFGYKLRMCQEV